MMGTSTLTFGAESGPSPIEAGPVKRISYRRQLIRALNAKLRAGQISRDDYWRFRRASYDREFIEGFVDEIEHAAKRAGTFLEDAQAWLKILLDWLIENWDVVLKILLSLLVLI